MGKDFYGQFTPLNIETILNDLEKQVQKIPSLVVNLAFELPSEEADKLGRWLRSNVSANIMFNTKLDPTLIAGCAFSWKGVYKDYSAKAKIEQNRPQILENVRKYLR